MDNTNKPSNYKINYKAKRLEIVFRDINGKRYNQVFFNIAEFLQHKWDETDYEENEIMFVIWGGNIIYSCLYGTNLTLQELIGYFA